eukprot:Gb_37738 [translate_table: standard]
MISGTEELTDLMYRVFRLQFGSERPEMYRKVRRFWSMFFIPLFLLIFSSNFVISEASSRLGGDLGSEENFIAGKQPLADFSTAPWLPGLKQIPAALAPDDDIVVDSNRSLILAKHRTRRPDILRKFKRYEGGWNITNKHYWASVGFTGTPGFVLAVLWFVAFGLALLLLWCCRRRIKGEHRGLHFSYWVSLVLLIVFTCAAIVGCILLSLGQDKFHREISHTLGFVVNQSDFTVENLRNVTEYLALAKTISVAENVIPADDKQQIDKLNRDLNAAANELESKTDDNADKIQKVLDAVRDALIVVAGVMLLLAVLGLLLSVLGFRHIIYILVIIGWFLVAGTFILCGVFIVLNNAIADTCLAMQGWVEHPYAETALDHILPCVNESTTNQTLYRSKEVTSDLVNVVNQVINNFANKNFPPSAVPVYYNQSGPLMPTLCNPFDPKLNDRQCSPREENFTNAPQVWQNYTCNVSSSGNCVTPGRVTPRIYTQLVAAVNVSFGLNHYTPFLVNLTDCTFVRETFTTISQYYCADLQLHIKWVYIGLALVSAGVMLSLVFWIIYTRQRHHRDEYFQPIGTKMMYDPSMEMESREKPSE